MQRRAETATHIWCGACKAMQPKVDFTRASASPSGLNYSCKAVVSGRNSQAHGRRRDEINARHALAREARKASPEHRVWALKRMLADARLRATKGGLEFSISAEAIHLPDTCPIFGTNLIYQARGTRTADSASLDRFDTSRGYSQDNVWVISWRANRIKSDASLDELQRLVRAMEIRHSRSEAGRVLNDVVHDGMPGVSA